MMNPLFKRLAVLVLLAIPGADSFAQRKVHSNSNIWAVLVAVSNGFENYRHQADICHAFHVLHDHGVPEEQIIVMMYDDIAHNERNPFPGQIYNHPNGQDVYAGVPKDYTRRLVTPENVMKVLRGQKPDGGSGKTLKSGPDDYVFVNFVGHGASGLLGMPFPAPEFTAKELLSTLHHMSNATKFKKLVLYVESCESGSMFANQLPEHLNIYATTASAPWESSSACYFDDKIGAYLGDMYSVKWMENSDKTNLRETSLKSQFLLVKEEVNTSHVQEYGQLDLAKEPVGYFQGENTLPPIILPQVEDDEPVPSDDVPVHLLIKNIKSETNPVLRKKLHVKLSEQFQMKSFVQSLFHKIAFHSGHPDPDAVATKRLDLADLECHDAVVKHFSKTCLTTDKNPFSYRFIYMLVNLCEDRIPIQAIKKATDKACSEMPIFIDFV